MAAGGASDSGRGQGGDLLGRSPGTEGREGKRPEEEMGDSEEVRDMVGGESSKRQLVRRPVY